MTESSDGDSGKKTLSGMSAYQLAKEEGYRGTEDEWRAMLTTSPAAIETTAKRQVLSEIERRDEEAGRFIGTFESLGDLPIGKKRDIAVINERAYVHNGREWIVMKRAEDEGITDRLMDEIDKRLDPERADKEIKETMGSPIVRRVVNFVLLILFGIFAIYTSAFYLEKELPQIEFLKHYLDQIVEVLKLFVG